MLTIDPSQKKVVWVLMVILIGAICITVVRMRPPTEPESVRQAAATPRTESAQGRVDVQVQSLSRNPFKAPEAFAMAQSRNNAAEMGAAMPNAAPTDNRPRSADQTVGTLPAVQPVVVSGMPKAEQAAVPERAKPAFALLATIRNSSGLSAVIRSSDSKVRVVNVGDTLEGGYKVRTLEPGRAVLMNGGDTIIAKKPQM